MRYFKLVTYTDGSEYETHEKLIDELTFRKYQKAIIEGADFIVAEDRVIKRKMIKEIIPADEIVAEHIRSGISLKTLGLPERVAIAESEHSGTSKYSKSLSEKMEMLPPDQRTAAQEDGARSERKP